MYYLGVDLGGTHIAIGIVTPEGKIVHQGSVVTQREREYPAIVKDMAVLSEKLLDEAKIDLSEIKGAGIGSPGIPDNAQGLIVYANNLNFRNVPLRSEFQKYLNLPIHIENDANCAALAESVIGAAREAAHSITITLGTGIGGGIVIDRKIYSGFNYSASELGHMVMMIQGEACTCGRFGCWEAYASATALIRQTRQAALQNPNSLLNQLVVGNLENINAKTVFDAAKEGDSTAMAVLERYQIYLAEGLINIINILQPEVLVIGGGICAQGEYLLAPVRKLISAGIYSKDIAQTAIKVAELGNEAGIVGAAFLCQ